MGVRQRILVGATNQMVTGAFVRLRKVSGSGDLVLHLEDAAGGLMDSIQVPASQVVNAHHWAGGTFQSTRTLANGQTYFLTLQTSAGTAYEAFPIRDGAFAGYGDFQPASTFGPGSWAEFNAGTSWIGWDQWSSTDRKDGDLQFYFTLE
jgi:hypothetical protein